VHRLGSTREIDDAEPGVSEPDVAVHMHACRIWSPVAQHRDHSKQHIGFGGVPVSVY
jgi:hypothetical protein